MERDQKKEIGEGSSLSSKEQRNLREKERRMHMKDLFFMLSSHVSPTQRLPVPRLIDHAKSYMIQLKEKIKCLKEKKSALLGEVGNNAEGSYPLPKLNYHSRDSTIQMNVVMDLNMKRVMLHELLSVFQDEGAQVMTANIHILNDRITYTIIAQVCMSDHIHALLAYFGSALIRQG
ncbi:unnamed protein product [Microthlaspi erraticum]|uniref:BHLH domain-containing protein n=1 Tax=Microthlaspi erraticum TaxID=1685480 RepID=A0A6D2HWX6_9BRAS|nr:unnamed protein product [Microthlaspi erraticum]